MNQVILISIFGIISAIAGTWKPWIGGIIGLSGMVIISYGNFSDVLFLSMFIIPVGFFYGLSAGIVGFWVYSFIKKEDTGYTQNISEKEVDSTL